MADLSFPNAASAELSHVRRGLTVRFLFAYNITHRRSEKEGPAVIGYEQAFQPRSQFSLYSSKNEPPPARFFKATPPARAEAQIRSILTRDSRASSTFHRILFS